MRIEQEILVDSRGAVESFYLSGEVTQLLNT